MQYLSARVPLHALTFDPIAIRHGLENAPPPEALNALMLLARQIAEPLLHRFGAGLRIHSGYRSPELNALYQSAPDSAHTRGEAMDFTLGRRQDDVIAYIRHELPFDHLRIGPHWLHVAYTAAERRHVEVAP